MCDLISSEERGDSVCLYSSEITLLHHILLKLFVELKKKLEAISYPLIKINNDIAHLVDLPEVRHVTGFEPLPASLRPTWHSISSKSASCFTKSAIREYNVVLHQS
jgi:hypothetical protein